jgi:hypothetical protein
MAIPLVFNEISSKVNKNIHELVNTVVMWAKVVVVLLELHIETAALQQLKAEIPVAVSCRTAPSEFSLHV